MTAASIPTALPVRPEVLAFWIKWVASVFQILGYAATAMELAPWHIYFFTVGLLGWLTVGLLWHDRAIVLIHVVALGIMAVGIFSQ